MLLQATIVAQLLQENTSRDEVQKQAFEDGVMLLLHVIDAQNPTEEEDDGRVEGRTVF